MILIAFSIGLCYYNPFFLFYFPFAIYIFFHPSVFSTIPFLIHFVFVWFSSLFYPFFLILIACTIPSFSSFPPFGSSWPSHPSFFFLSLLPLFYPPFYSTSSCLRLAFKLILSVLPHPRRWQNPLFSSFPLLASSYPRLHILPLLFFFSVRLRLVFKPFPFPSSWPSSLAQSLLSPPFPFPVIFSYPRLPILPLTFLLFPLTFHSNSSYLRQYF